MPTNIEIKARLACVSRTRALGVTQIVVKTRLLYHVGQTRLHLDSVDGLGDFLELEVMLRPGQEVAEGEAIAVDLMERLGIRDDELCSTAYADMLIASPADGGTFTGGGTAMVDRL